MGSTTHTKCPKCPSLVAPSNCTFFLFSDSWCNDGVFPTVSYNVGPDCALCHYTVSNATLLPPLSMQLLKTTELLEFTS